jgi:hypothetical protein
MGTELNLDSKTQKLTKYNAGLLWEPALTTYVGLKHESEKDIEQMQVGKCWLYFYHLASAANTVGSEFSLDWQKKLVEARFGLTHRFNDNTVGKLRINNKGVVDGALKHTLNENASICFVSQLHS